MPEHPGSSHNTSHVLQSVGRELKRNPPAILAKTRRKSGKARAEKQRVAILLSKSRRRGAKIKRRPRPFVLISGIDLIGSLMM